MDTSSPHFLDRRRARVIAGLVALAVLLALAQVWMNANRVDPLGRPLTAAGEQS
jgi:ferric-dicitrate binding protein FerR (iron transport regulator)